MTFKKSGGKSINAFKKIKAYILMRCYDFGWNAAVRV